MYVITGTSFWNVVPERNDKKIKVFVERNWNGTKNWRLERNWNGTKKLETGTELERNEKYGRNEYLERNGNMKCRSNGLVGLEAFLPHLQEDCSCLLGTLQEQTSPPAIRKGLLHKDL